MKFPKSVHPEGWLDHIDRSKESTPVARPAGQPLKPRMTRPSAKIRATDPLGAAPVGYVPPQPMAAAIPPIHASTAPAVAAPGANPERRSNGAMPWVVGIGAGVVLLGVAATMSRQFTSNEAPALPPTVVGEAASPAATASSPEDTLLAEAPPAAGAVTTPEPQAEAPAPAVVEPVAPAPAPKVAETPKPAEAPKVAEKPKAAEAPRVAQAEPVTRTLTPQPQTWVLSQAEPPPAALRDATPVTPVTPQSAAPVATQPAAPVATPQPVAPVVPQPVTETTTPPVAQAVPPLAQPQPAVQPPVVQPTQPPVVAQQTPPVTPPVANPEDTGITIKVREALASDTTLAAVPIAVSTDHGVVKLEGQAPDSMAKERATVVAASAAGVRGVDNRLTLPSVTVGAVTPNSGS